MLKITRMAISQKRVNQIKKKKISVLHYIFLKLSVNFWIKIQNTHCYSHQITFSTSGQSVLNGPPNGPAVI